MSLAAVNRPTHHLFGRHVTERSENDTSGRGCDGRHRSLGRAEGHELSGKAEVENLDRPVTGQKEILRLQIPMDDPLGVRGRQPLGYRSRDIHRFAPGQCACVHALTNRLAVEQLHHRERQAVDDAELVNRQDARMRERRHGPGFRLEPLTQKRVGGDVRGHDLDRDVTTEPGVPRTVDLTHASRADGGDDLILSKTKAGC